jgi:hypothetical protein
MKWIRDTYKVPAKRGMRVMANGEMGTIIAARGGHLKVKLDMYKRPELYHLTWHMVYYTGKSVEVF